MNLSTPRQAISRFTSREEPLSDMVALLAELDPRPLAALLQLPTDDIVLHREYNLGHRRGRVDMLVVSAATAQPLAILEAKVSDALRDGQLEKYEEWAQEQEEKPAVSVGRYLVDLNGLTDAPLERWQVLDQATLLGAWHSSANEHCRWLSGLLYDSVREVDLQAEENIGDATAWSTHDVVTRRLRQDLERWLASHAPDAWCVNAHRDNGGNPMLSLRLAHPSRQNVWLLVDLRSPGRGARGATWTLRLAMRTFASDFSSAAHAQQECFAALMEALELFSMPRLTDLLTQRVDSALAAALSAPSHGYKRAGVSTAEIRQILLGSLTAQADRHEPVPAAAARYLYQDGGLQYGSKFGLDLSRVNRHDLQRLLVALLTGLYAALEPSPVRE